MAYKDRDNPDMDIVERIAKNLRDWMSDSIDLNTVDKVAEKSSVGFGTVRRVRNGEGNPTITNLEQIAQAFGRRAIDLLETPSEPYDIRPSLTVLKADQPSLDEQRLIEGFRHVDPKDRETILFLTDRALAAFTERSGSKD